MQSPDSLKTHSRYSVEAIREFGSIEYFCGISKLQSDPRITAPYVLSVDSKTEAYLARSVVLNASRLRSENLPLDTPSLVGVIVGSGHPATLFAVAEGGELRQIEGGRQRYSARRAGQKRQAAPDSARA